MDALIAATAALIGVLVGGLLQLEAARIQQLRGRQLDAASNFSEACMEVFNALDREMRSLGSPAALSGSAAASWLASFKAGVDSSREALRRTMLLLGHVEMLFGVQSETAQAAGAVVKGLHAVFAELDKRPGSAEVLTAEYESAADSFGSYYAAAHDQFSRGLLAWGVRPWAKRP